MKKIKSEELEKTFKEFCETQGLALSFKGNNPKDSLGDFDILRGEVWLDLEKNQLFISSKNQKIRDISYFLSFSQKEKTEIPLDEKMRRLWQTYFQRMVLGEVAKIILPKAHASLFISLKPKNFSTLEGESLEGSFFEKKGWSFAPDARGKFVQTGGNQNAEIKKDNVGSHTHPAIAHYLLRDTGSILGSNTGGGISVIRDSGRGRVGNLLTADMGHKETRPKNIAILSIWKISE